MFHVKQSNLSFRFQKKSNQEPAPPIMLFYRSSCFSLSANLLLCIFNHYSFYNKKTFLQ